MRIRREIRSIHEADRNAYFSSILVMRNTSMHDGKRKYGNAFRSYNYLVLKHATSAFHSCEDQGHIYTNQLTYHRAILMEFEESLLSILRQMDGHNLTALPYWNWFLDVDSHQDWVESSLWKYWGSPYGDPLNHYCIYDPIFNTQIGSMLDTKNNDPIVSAHEKLEGRYFMNAYGFYRSPWNENKCPGIARNPGWIFGAQSETPVVNLGVRDCWDSLTYSEFGRCSQGSGVHFDGFDFGPHNIPHIAMGTIDDHFFGQNISIAFVVFAAFLLTLCMSPCITGIVCLRNTKASTIPFILRFTVYIVETFFVSIMLGLIVLPICAYPGIWQVTGLAHVNNYLRWNIRFFGRDTIDFHGQEWRNKTIECPNPMECNGASCRCTFRMQMPLLNLLPLSTEFSGSDFWDGAFSINENFFFSIHGLYDLLLLDWSKRKFVNLAIERTACFNGTNTISPEFCFTFQDVGLHGDRDVCITHEDILDASKLPYSYDVITETYSWIAEEPTNALCPSADVVCEASRNNAPITFTGSVICYSWDLETVQTNESLCDELSKPLPPVKICDCMFERLREKNLHDRTFRSSALTSMVFIGAGGLCGFIIVRYLYWKKYESQNSSVTEYESIELVETME